MTKTLEEMAEEYTRDWWGSLPEAEGMRKSARENFLAGYNAAQEHAHAALEEAEARIQELRDRLMEESGGRLRLFKDDADAKAAYQEALEEVDLDKVYHQGLKDGAPQWISVKDRLPEIDEWCSWWDMSGATEPCTAFRGVDDIETWWENYTHWMSLPSVEGLKNED
jgi:hypothetical protein